MRTYLSYLKNVLGINEFLTHMPSLPDESPASLSGDKKWRVVFLTQNEWSRPERALFLKISEAMKLTENSFVVHEISPDALTEILEEIEMAQHVVCFSFELKSALETLGYAPHFSPDPRAMLSNPSLKKEAWEVLKKL